MSRNDTGVETVEVNDASFGVVLFVDHQAHGNSHPEELGSFNAAVFLPSLIDDEVAVVKGLDAEIVKVEVGSRIDCVSQAVEVVFEQARMNTLDFGAANEVLFEGPAVKFTERTNAVTNNVPLKDFLVNVGEKDTAGKLGEVTVLFDEALGVEDDCFLEILFAHLVKESTAEFLLDLLGSKAEVEAGHSEVDTFAKVESVPKVAGTVVTIHDDHGFLSGFKFESLFFLFLIALSGTVGTIKNVGFGHFEVALAHQFFLNTVL